MNILLKIMLLFTFCVSFSNSFAQKKPFKKPKVVYSTDNLVITQISENGYEHTSYLQTQDFGKVPCNGLVVTDKNEAIIFDTPTNDTGSAELIQWINEKLNSKIDAVIATHFHNDCVGGLQAFHQKNIPSYANNLTIKLAAKNNFMVPQNGFDDSLQLPLGDKNVIVKFFGEGHTRDNVVGYFPAEKILFGGCLIKELDATKGYLGDANEPAWSETVTKVKNAYPNVKIVVPGHGEIGNKMLLDYTIKLFQGFK